MREFAIRRLLHGFVALSFVLVLMFFLTHALGDPVELMLPVDAPQAMVEELRHDLGLDRPLHIQFADYLGGIVRLDFGDSLWQNTPAIPLVVERIPRSLWLGIVAIAIALVGGVALGTAAAIKPFSISDKIFSFISLLAASTIDFWIAIMLILLVSVILGWLPTSGFEGYLDWKYVIMPAVALALRPMGRIAMVTRPAFIDELGKEYVTALRARGLGWPRIIIHVARNVLIIVFNMAGWEFISNLCGGGIAIEVIFAWPGLGLLLIQSLNRSDWVLLVASSVIFSVMVVIFHMFLDIVTGWVNPRIRIE